MSKLKSGLLVLDTRDDRREVWHLLHRLSPRDRVRYLIHACARVRQDNGSGPRVGIARMAARVTAAYRCEKANEGVTNEVYGDLLMCAAPPWNLDLLAAALELEQIGKGKMRVPRVRPELATSPASGHWVATS